MIVNIIAGQYAGFTGSVLSEIGGKVNVRVHIGPNAFTDATIHKECVTPFEGMIHHKYQKGDVIQRGEKGGIKYSKGKLQWRTLPLFLLQPFGRIFDYGREKYKLHNWTGLSADDLLDAAFRHLTEHQEGIFNLWQTGNLKQGAVPPSIRDLFERGDKGHSHVIPSKKLFDKESHLPHIDHAITSLIMYRFLIVNGTQELPDDSKL